jgi:hypothetical protein
MKLQNEINTEMGYKLLSKIIKEESIFNMFDDL